jgi:hypothetical protein
MPFSKTWPVVLVVPLLACTAKSSDEDTFMLPIDTATATDTSADTMMPDEDSGNDDSDDDGDDTSAGDSDESGQSGPCAAGMCAEVVPDGWFGPVLRWDTEPDSEMPPPLCNDDGPDPSFTLLGGYADPGPVTCECTCGLNIGALCTSYAYLYEGAQDCSGASMLQMLTTEDECESVTINDGSIQTYAYTAGAATCSADVTEDIPDVPWDLQVAGCRNAEWGAECGNKRACLPPVPDGFSDQLCIFANGDMECPGGDYSEKTVLYSGADDDRRCGPCACDTPPVSTCTGTFEFYARHLVDRLRLRRQRHRDGIDSARVRRRRLVPRVQGGVPPRGNRTRGRDDLLLHARRIALLSGVGLPHRCCSTRERAVLNTGTAPLLQLASG